MDGVQLCTASSSLKWQISSLQFGMVSCSAVKRGSFLGGKKKNNNKKTTKTCQYVKVFQLVTCNKLQEKTYVHTYLCTKQLKFQYLLTSNGPIFVYLYIYINPFTDIEKYMYFGQQNFVQSEENRKIMLFFLSCHLAPFLLPLLPSASAYSSVSFNPLNTLR